MRLPLAAWSLLLIIGACACTSDPGADDAAPPASGGVEPEGSGRSGASDPDVCDALLTVFGNDVTPVSEDPDEVAAVFDEATAGAPESLDEPLATYRSAFFWADELAEAEDEEQVEMVAQVTAAHREAASWITGHCELSEPLWACVAREASRPLFGVSASPEAVDPASTGAPSPEAAAALVDGGARIEAERTAHRAVYFEIDDAGLLVREVTVVDSGERGWTVDEVEECRT